MGKIAFVVIWLVPEGDDKDNTQLEKEILETLRCDRLGEIEKVTVLQ